MPVPEPILAPTPAPVPTRQASGGTNIKDTIESILVAFILAFVFRAFVVEAFVIPTGSMATTLLGAHTRFHCPDCGYDFDVNYQALQRRGDPEGDDPSIPATAGDFSGSIYCPNCGFKMPAAQTDNPPVFYGDRILVLKYQYLLQHPQRWDVVVFKAPIDREHNYSTNYIKRLIGRPGESVIVLDGDVYIREPGSNDFVVQNKPKVAQDAMWRLVYNNDFHPTDQQREGGVHPWLQPWTMTDGTGWKTDDKDSHGRTFYFDNMQSASTLRFSPVANPTAQSTSDYLTYDQQPPEQRPKQRSVDSNFPTAPADIRDGDEIPVSDLDLRLTYHRTGGTGPFEVRLTKRGHTFIGRITPNEIALFQEFQGKQTQIGKSTPISGNRLMRIELSNADYQVILRVDDKVVAQSTPADFAPNIPDLLNEYDNHRTPPPGDAQIAGGQQQCEISHVSLWRDDYYYNEKVLWATPTDFPHHAQVLGPDEYFVMGDNSILSYDARLWDRTVKLPAENLDVAAGRVPGRFLLGKAFYVYWPAGYMATPMLPAFVPNFGAMRFIH